MKFFFYTIITIFMSAQLFAFESAKEYCARHPISGFSRLHAVEDRDFSDEKITIHSYTKKKIDKSKPTILFFSGGPGARTRASEFDLKNYNIIFYEQRGMGCSRPESISTFLNPTFYSSEKSVLDAIQILDDYGLQSVIAYGHSYGTVLATMFASKYPERTKKVILEGVIGKADEGIWKSERRRLLLQKLFGDLDKDLKEKILSYSNHPRIPSNWYSVIGTMMSYLDDGYNTYKKFLENILEMNEDVFITLVQNFYSPKGFLQVGPLEASDGEVTFGMITCQELSGSRSQSSMSMIFDREKKLIWDDQSSIVPTYCMPLGIDSELAPLDMKDYPIMIPVIYLVGENDGATDLSQALYHRAHVAKGNNHFYLLKSGGHLPNLAALSNDRECRDLDDCESMKGTKTQVIFFEHILESDQALNKKQIDLYNQMLELKWDLIH